MGTTIMFYFREALKAQALPTSCRHRPRRRPVASRTWICPGNPTKSSLSCLLSVLTPTVLTWVAVTGLKLSHHDECF